MKPKKRPYQPWPNLKSGGIEKFLGMAQWLYPRQNAPVSRHVLRCCIDRLEGLAQLVDAPTFAALLRRCGDVGATDEARRLHRFLTRSGRIATPFYGNLTIDMYGKLGLVDDALQVFHSLGPKRNFYSWEFMTGVLLRNSRPQQAVEVLRWGQLMGLRLNLPMRGFLVCAYAQCGHLQEARQILEEKEDSNAMWWNVLLAAYVEKGLNKQAMQLALHSLCGRSTSHTFIILAAAAGNLRDFSAAKEIHREAFQRKFLPLLSGICCALMRMYAKCDRFDGARSVFEASAGSHRVECADMFSIWKTMINEVYFPAGKNQEVLYMYRRMILEGLPPDGSIYSAVVQACKGLGTPSGATEGEIIRRRFIEDTAHTSFDLPPLDRREEPLLAENVAAALNLMATRGWRMLRRAR